MISVQVRSKGDHCAIFVYAPTEEAWRAEPQHSTIRAWALAALERGDALFVEVGERVFLILPTEEVDVTERYFTVVRRTEDQWAVLTFDTEDEGRTLRRAFNSPPASDFLM